jgi:hypothetical protein
MGGSVLKYLFSPAPKSMGVYALPLSILGLLLGCDDSSSPENPSLPGYFFLDGSASLQAGEQTLDCHINFIVELAGETLRTDTFVEYVGTMGGGAGRQVLNPDGSGFALNGDAFSEVRARLTYPNQVVIDAINLPPGPIHDPPSFFEELIHLEGVFGADDLITGEWLCAPYFTDLGGFADETLFADGLWLTENISN